MLLNNRSGFLVNLNLSRCINLITPESEWRVEKLLFSSSLYGLVPHNNSDTKPNGIPTTSNPIATNKNRE